MGWSPVLSDDIVETNEHGQVPMIAKPEDVNSVDPVGRLVT